jgi:hypothetical protein
MFEIPVIAVIVALVIAAILILAAKGWIADTILSPPV